MSRDHNQTLNARNAFGPDGKELPSGRNPFGGSAGRNILGCDGCAFVDLATARRISPGGNRCLWPEAKVFNLFNHVICDHPEL
jgi:hypothetical protein